MMPLNPDEVRRVSPYVTNSDRPVFALRNLPPEVCAYLFARYSRSEGGVRPMLLAMLDESDGFFAGARVEETESAALRTALEKARAFAEKWISGYGHKSPAEDAPLHLCFEGVSILFSKIIEDFRLTSPQEKSTRYVVFSRDTLYRPVFNNPDGSENPELARKVSSHLDWLMDVYQETIRAVKARCEREFPREEGRSERGYDALMTTKACDLCRYLLPVATLTNLGVFANAREWEYIFTRLLSHELPEARALGEMARAEALKVAPTLIKYAGRSDYYAETPPRMRELSREFEKSISSAQSEDLSPEEALCSIVSFDPDAEAHLAAAMLYPCADAAYETLFRRFASPEAAEERDRILDAYLSGRGPHDAPLRAVENSVYRIEFVCDYGAYRDLQRHRMGTSFDPCLTPSLGPSLPEEIEAWGYAPVFRDVFDSSARLWDEIMGTVEDPLQAQYALPMMTRYRFFRVWNFRQAMNVIRLRSAREGHVSYRRVAQALFREIERVHPRLAQFIEVDLNDYALARATAKATR